MNVIRILISLPCCIAQIFLLYDFFSNFFEKKTSARWISVIAVAAAFTVNLFDSRALKLIFIPVVFWIYISLIFEAERLLRMAYFLMAYSVMLAVELLYGVLPIPGVVGICIGEVRDILDYTWRLLIVRFIGFIVLFLLKRITSKERETNRLFAIYLCVPVSTLGAMLTIFYSSAYIKDNYLAKFFLLLFFVFMLIGNILLFYAFQKYSENLKEDSRQQMKMLYLNSEIERLVKINQINDRYNEMVHNASHYLKIIGQLAYEKKSEEIIRVVEKLNGNLKPETVYEFCNHRMLNIILSEYLLKANASEVGFDVYVEPGCSLNHIEDMDLIALIGNILDNALTAAKAIQKKGAVTLRIFKQEIGDLCVIKVTNDFDGNIRRCGDRLISTKAEKGIHGIGLASVSRIAEQYDGYSECYIEGKKFFTVVILPA